MLELVGRRYDSDRAVRIQIEIGRITRITPAAAAAGLPYVAPGFCDLQINGYQGVEFNDPKLTVEQVRKAALSQDQFGVTRYLATCTTDSYEVFCHSFATIAQAIDELPEVAARLAGIHMEGPYIAPDDGPRGAHPKQHVRPPDWNEFSRIQQAARGKIKLLTLSPEYEGSADFIKKVVESGVLVAIGHTKATSEQISAAVDAGARMSTHLGNGAHPQIKRHPNYIWDQLAEDRLVASLITDGHHLPPSVVKSMVRAKTPARCVLVSDITGLGGMPPGRYATGLGDLEVLECGKLVLDGQRDILAGASQPIHVCVANVMRFAGVNLQTAVEMASTSPLRLIGESDRGLEVGEAANLVLFDLPKEDVSPLGIRMTVNGGEVVFQTQ
ncbi:MAG: amidohydrolase family protein [Planctomycetales bacterium]|nr:amidohydrolase family protein [Planctomycetales bacterium]